MVTGSFLPGNLPIIRPLYSSITVISEGTSRYGLHVSGGGNSDKMTNYVIAIEGVERQIEEVTEEIRTLKKGLAAMEQVLNNYQDDGIERQVFDLVYIKHKRASEAAEIIPCDRRTVYRYKKIIEAKILQKSESCHKMSQNL